MNNYAKIVLSEYGMRRYTYELINRFTSEILQTKGPGHDHSYYIPNEKGEIDIDLPEEVVETEKYLARGGSGYRRIQFPGREKDSNRVFVNL